MTKFEEYLDNLYFEKNISNKFIEKKLEKVYRRDLKRLYPNLEFEYAIHYCGYERKIMKLYQFLNAKRFMYLHSDMKQEISTKGNIHETSFKSALDNYDKIVTVRESSANEIINYYPKIKKDKVVVAHNLNNIDLILKMSQKEVIFDKETYCNITLDNLKEILNNNNVIKFINIARFSYEKGQDRLINAFSKYHKTHPNSYLIIIGGYGKEFEKINEMVKDKENIIIIRSINNPYSILNKCDLFILSSHYEGLPITIMEALILEKPVVSTNITGPSEFLGQGYGTLVENSEKGILKGMEDFTNGKIKNTKKFDAYEFNKNALNEFNKLIN